MVAINGSPIERINTRIIDATLVNHLYLPNIVELNLEFSNVKNVAAICEGDLPNLEVLNFSHCHGIVDSDLKFCDGFLNLSNVKLQSLDVICINLRMSEVFFAVF